MSCYHPKIMYATGMINVETGKHVFGFKKKCCSEDFVHAKDNGWIIVPCGKCIGCRLDYSRRWADRMMLELQTSKKALFVTLTYDEDHVHGAADEDTGEFLGLTLSKRDCQLFMKMVRKKFPDVKVRFYASGEYGENTHRPHLHLIIFGIGIQDFPDKVLRGKNELGQLYYQVKEIDDCWHEFDGKRDLGLRGFTCCSDVSYNTMAYVSRYVMKKVKQDQLDAHEIGVLPEFSLMSRRPGIGLPYLLEHPDCLELTKISLGTKDGSKSVYIPQYYINQLNRDSENNPLYNPDFYVKIKEQRVELANDKMMDKLSRTSLSFLEQMEVEERQRISSLKALKRGL